MRGKKKAAIGFALMAAKEYEKTLLART